MNRHKVPLAPYSAILPIAWVDLSTYCNAGCPQCHRTGVSTGKKVEWLPLIQWSLECFKRRFDYMGSIKEFEFCGSWGDPVMNKDLLEICRYIIENSNANVSINTNGSIRDESWWWELGSVGRERLKVVFDVDGTTQEMHEKYRQNTSLEKIKNNMIMLSQTPAKIKVHTILFKHNEKHCQAIRDMIEKDWGIELFDETLDYLVQESQRFWNGPEFRFKTANGESELLEQITDFDNPFLDTRGPPVRDFRYHGKK